MSRAVTSTCSAISSSVATSLSSLNTAGEGTPVAIDDAAYEAAKKALGVRVIDDQTIEFDLLAPAPYFPTVAGLWVLFPAKQELIEAGGTDWWKDPTKQIGNGPFQITEMDEGQLVSFEPNANYWGGTPKLNKIEYVYINDSDTALEAYKAGDLDILNPDPAQLPAIQSDPDLADQYVVYASANTWYLNLNLTQKPFDDLKVRQAFAYAFDRETYCNDIQQGTCVATYSLGAGRRAWFNPDRCLQIRSGGGEAGAGRVDVWRSGQLARDQVLLQQR